VQHFHYITGCFEWGNKQFAAVVERRYVAPRKADLQKAVTSFFEAQLTLHDASKVVDLQTALDETAAAIPLDRIATELPWLYREASWKRNR
jgi:hypothetical protein